MKKSDRLKQRRAMKFRAYQSILNKAKAEKRELTTEEEEQIEVIEEEIESLDDRITALEEQEAEDADNATEDEEHNEDEDDEDDEEKRRKRNRRNGRQRGGEGREMRNIKKRYSFARALNATRMGKQLDGLEKEMNDEAVREVQRSGVSFDGGFSIPSSMVRADSHTVTQDSGEYGGMLVTDALRPVDSFIPKLFLEESGATFLSGLQGNVPLPVVGNYDFEWLGEVASLTIDKEKIEGPTLKPKRAGAAVGLSNQLLIQSEINIEALIWEKLRQGAARALNGAAINGAGGTAPTGILNYTGVSQAAASAAVAPTWDHITELPGIIEQDDATEHSLAYLLNPKLAAKLRTVKKDAGSGRFLMENKEIDGVNTMMTSLVPQLGTTPNFTQPLIYGDWSQLFIGQWAGINFLADPYTGGKSAQLFVYVNMYADVQIANPKAFAVNKFLTA